ncbi:MAG TPA: TldD/PmbA family protein [Thermoanaerobaculia bacterium]|jgi:predicted Zn-dependent protease|nr:TldD/PmbA family protein [Thermoanaerobaculia bacterium]
MTMLSKDEAQALLKKVVALSKAEGCEVSLNGNTSGNIRTARNTVTTSGQTDDLTLVVQSSFGKRAGTTTINELDDASLEKAVRRSEELAKLAPENPELMPPLPPQQYVEAGGWFDATARITPELRAKGAADSINPSRAKKLVAAGFLQDFAGFQALMNSKGLFAYYPSTNVNFTVTVRSEDGTGSGYATSDHNDVGELDTGRTSQVAIDKALRSMSPKAVEPGKYTVILEPAASAGILQFMAFGFDARQADEGRSFLSKPGGGNKKGQKIVDERVSIWSDPADPRAPTAPWAGDGRPRQKTMWIENGAVKNLYTSRFWAAKTGIEPLPFPANMIMSGGTASTEDLIRDTKRGILVTRTWYIRMVDPQTVLVTGLTRDGSFMIEDGKLSFPVKNFRFNESPVIMLNNLDALGKPERFGDGDGGGASLIPPMRIRDFTFTSLSDAV